nr:hypothetical protein HUO10_005983 [Paraburkholderia busanensis]
MSHWTHKKTMNLITKLFGTRPRSTAPDRLVYLLPGEAKPLRTAIASVATSTDDAFLKLCLGHRSGYIREAAIERAVKLGRGSLLSSIILCVNDWLPEVRRAATTALVTLLTVVPPEHFVAQLPLLRNLMLATRTDHRSWLVAFEKRLIQAGGSNAIIAAITGNDFQLRRAAFLTAVDHQLLPVVDTIALGLRSGDVMLARRAVELFEHVPSSDLPGYVDLASTSPFGPIRLLAFKFISQRPDDFDFERVLWRMTLDSQGSLRSAAAHCLLGRGEDVIGHCCKILSTGQRSTGQIRACLSILVELNAREAVSMLTHYASDVRVDIRTHSLLLQARALSSSKDEIASRALLDPSRKVRKVGVQLCTRGAFVSLGLIKTMLAQSGDGHAALAICARDAWDKLVCIAAVTELEAPGTNWTEEAENALRQWLRNPTSSWTRPGNEHRLILSNPDVISRLFLLSPSRVSEIRERLKEVGINV